MFTALYNYVVEKLGIRTNRYFSEKWIRHHFSSERAKEFMGVSNKDLSVFIFVDPPSHAKSYMGLTALVYAQGADIEDEDDSWDSVGGGIYLVGVADISIESANMMALENVVYRFTNKVIDQLVTRKRPAKALRIVPIVECNNNEFQSVSLSTKILQTATLRNCRKGMPFNQDFFKKNISSDFVGVFTDKVNKMGGIQTLNQYMSEKRIYVWKNCVTMGNVHLTRSEVPSLDHALETLVTGLIQYKETEHGASGKTQSNTDDSATSLILNCYWSYCINVSGIYADMQPSPLLP
jgi:hypothetical protein